MNVLQLNDNFGYGGTEKNLELIGRNLGSNFDSFFCCFGEPGPRFERLIEEGYNGICTEDVKELQDFIVENDIDVVHYHGGGLDNIVLQISDDVDFIVKTANFGWPSSDSEEFRRLVDRYVFPSKFTLYRYRALHSESKVNFKSQVVYHLIDHSDLNRSTNLVLEDDRVVIGRIGRSDENKWSDLFLEGFDKLAQTHDVVLLILNPPDSVRKGIEKRGLQNSVEIVEDIELGEISSFYDSIDILAHSSHIGESFGYVIAEAMASTKPVVVESTPIKDNAQIELVDNDENGYVVAGKDSFSEALQELVEHEELRREMGRKAREKSQKEFEVDKIAKEFEELYRNLDLDNANSDFDFTEFREEYRRRLTELYGKEDRYHRFERYAWYISEFSSSELVYRKARAVARRLKKLY